jgi:hypothetical protein
MALLPLPCPRRPRPFRPRRSRATDSSRGSTAPARQSLLPVRELELDRFHIELTGVIRFIAIPETNDEISSPAVGEELEYVVKRVADDRIQGTGASLPPNAG